MLRPSHPLFQVATDFPAPAALVRLSPAQIAASMPADFSNNTTTVSADTMIDAGDSSHDGPKVVPLPKVEQPGQQQPAQQVQQSLPQPQPQQAFQAPQPLPEALQPQQPTAPAAAPADPLAAMTQSMRLAFPDESASQIAARVASALAPAQQQQQAPTVDPDQARAEELNTQIEALKQQAADEGSSDFDEQIASLKEQKLKLETRLEIRQEIQDNVLLEEFAHKANEWDRLASQAWSDADVPGTPLKAAVDAKIQEVLTNDPEFFTRSPDAGYALVAAEAGKLGIAPKIAPQGAAPAPGSPQNIQVPVAMPGSMQGSHRPPMQVQQSPQQAFAVQLAAAEQGGFAGELALAKQFARGGIVADGVNFAF